MISTKIHIHSIEEAVSERVSALICGLQEENTAMHLAVMRGHTEVLQKLVETGEDVDDRNIVSALEQTTNLPA